MEEKKKSAGMLGSILKEAEVGHVAAATRCFPVDQRLTWTFVPSLPVERHPRSEEQDGEVRGLQTRPERRGGGADADLRRQREGAEQAGQRGAGMRPARTQESGAAVLERG